MTPRVPATAEAATSAAAVGAPEERTPVADPGAGTFDPAKRIIQIEGRKRGTLTPYLEVKWRLAWLRDRQPDAVIETDLVEHSPPDGIAVFRATVTLPSGGSATGWGMSLRSEFRDYLEKAETAALGRALAALGFGAQHCGADYDEAIGAGAPADGQPVSIQDRRQQNPGAATDAQLGRIRAMVKAQGIAEVKLAVGLNKTYGVSALDQLSKQQASDMIDRLTASEADHQRRAAEAAALGEQQ